MTFRSCRLDFTCDLCESEITCFADADLENIPSIAKLAEHEFDELDKGPLPGPQRVIDGHICAKCVGVYDMMWIVVESLADAKKLKAEYEQMAKEENEYRATQDSN